MEAYLLQVIENEDETVQSPQSWEVGLKEENIPSEGKEKGESHGSHTQPQYDVTSLKQALAWANFMQRNLPQTIGQMSPEEQLFFVQSVYSLNTALMVNQSLQQLQQSPVIPELAALLLGMGQPQPCQYEELCSQDYFPPIVNALSSTLAKHEIHFVDNPHVMEAIQALEACQVLEESGSENQQLSLDIMCPKFDKELSSDIIIFHFAAISPEKKKVLDRRPLKKLLGENRDGYKFTGSSHTPGIFFDDRSDQEDLRKNIIPPTCTFAGFLEEKYVEAIARESIPTEATSCMKYNSSLSSALDTEPKGVEKRLNKYCSTAATECEAELYTESKCDTKELPPAPLNTFPKNDTPLPDHSPTQWCWKTRLKRLNLKNIRYYLCRASQHSLEELDTECQETICHAVVSIPFTPEEAVSLLQILKSKELNVFTSCDKYGNVPLHIAVMKSNTEIVRELTRICPAAVKMANHNGATPVDLAFGMRHSDIMDCLLNRAIEDDKTNPENLRLLQSLLPRAMKNGYTDYLRILLKLQSQYSLAIDFNCTDSEQHTASFYLQQQPPHVQEAVGMILNISTIGPAFQDSLKVQLLKKTEHKSCTCPSSEAEEQTPELSPTQWVVACPERRDDKRPAQPSTELLPGTFAGSTVQSNMSSDAVTAYLPNCRSEEISPLTNFTQVESGDSTAVAQKSEQLSMLKSCEEQSNPPDTPQQSASAELCQSGYPPNHLSIATQLPVVTNHHSDSELPIVPSKTFENGGKFESYGKKNRLKRSKSTTSSTSKQHSLSGTNGPPIQPLGSGSSSCDSEEDKKRVRLTEKQKMQRRRAEQRVMETRVSSSEGESFTVDLTIGIDQDLSEPLADKSDEEGDPQASEGEAPLEESQREVQQQMVLSHAGTKQSCTESQPSESNSQSPVASDTSTTSDSSAPDSPSNTPLLCYWSDDTTCTAGHQPQPEQKVEDSHGEYVSFSEENETSIRSESADVCHEQNYYQTLTKFPSLFPTGADTSGQQSTEVKPQEESNSASGQVIPQAQA